MDGPVTMPRAEADDVFIEVSEDMVPQIVSVAVDDAEEGGDTPDIDALETASVADSIASDRTEDLEELDARLSKERLSAEETTDKVEDAKAMAVVVAQPAEDATRQLHAAAIETNADENSHANTKLTASEPNDASLTNNSGSSSPVDLIDVKSSSDSSGSSSDSSSNDSSDSSDSSSDSEVEDVTAQYKATSMESASRGRTMSESEGDDEDTEQWFQGHELETDGLEVVGVVGAKPTGDDDVDAFLLPDEPTETARGSASKRRRSEDENPVDNQDASAGEVTTSSSEVDEYPSGDDLSYPRPKSKSSNQRKRARGALYPQPLKSAASTKYTSIPAKFSIFEKIPPDDDGFPILKGIYKVRGGHRAHFSGEWAFTEAKFSERDVSKFEYSTSYLHGRSDWDERPFSGKYSGYFMLRQFHGNRTRIKDDQVEFHFLPIATDSSDDEVDDQRYQVVGEGKNRYGRFLLRGYLNASDGRMTVRRRYLE